MTPTTVTEYIALAGDNVREPLIQLREAILAAAPEATEIISWQMPAYKMYGKPLVYFAGFTSHVSLFPGKEAVEAFREELSGYKATNGTIRFAADRKIPAALVKKIVKFCIKQNKATYDAKQKAKAKK